MVERSKKPSSRKASIPRGSRRAPFEREQVVLLEAMRGDFRVFGEALQGFDAKLQGRDATLQSFRAEVDARFDRVDYDIGLLKDAIASNTRGIKNVEIALTNKVDRDEVEAIAQRVARQG